MSRLSKRLFAVCSVLLFVLPTYSAWPWRFSLNDPNSITVGTKDMQYHISLKDTPWENEHWTTYACYNQTAWQRIYDTSCPFYGTVYNIVAGAGYSFSGNGDSFSKIEAGYEHKSNGRPDDGTSRSFNYAFLTYTHTFSLKDMSRLELSAKGFVGTGWWDEDYHNIEYLFRNLGCLQAKCSFHSATNMIFANLEVTPFDYFKQCQLKARFCVRPSKQNIHVPHVILEYNYGIEALHDYGRLDQELCPYHSIRLGVCFTALQ
ncbi:MAG: phospholipase A [Bacteroidaceae bacterium]|nr:phospholipase A [Bacteroidaceae bacterium]